MIGCECNPTYQDIFDSAKKEFKNVYTITVPCSGILHVAAISYALQQFRGVFIISCSQYSCVNRLGPEHLINRLKNGQGPEAPANYKSENVHIFTGTDFEKSEGKEEFHSFMSNLGFAAKMKKDNFQYKKILFPAIFSIFILLLLSLGSAIPYSITNENSLLRLAIRLPGKTVDTCRDLTPEEINKIPMHMRKKQECTKITIPYEATLTMDNQVLFSKTLESRGMRSDKPILIEQNIEVTPGLHKIKMSLVPKSASDISSHINGIDISELDFDENFIKGRAVVISYDTNERKLFLLKNAVK